MANETIYLGPMSIQNQTVGIANEVVIPMLDDVKWDGIVGLSYANQKTKDQKIITFFDNIIQQNILNRNIFSYVLSDKQGHLSFGELEPEFHNGPIYYSNVIEQKYYSIRLLDVTKVSNRQSNRIYETETKSDGIKLCGQEGCKAVIDTGTYLIYGP